MSEWVIARGGFVVATAIALGIIGIEDFFAKGIADEATKQTMTCEVKGPVKYSSAVALKLDCGGRDLTLRTTDVVLSYLKKPGPLTCDVSASSRFTCKERE